MDNLESLFVLGTFLFQIVLIPHFAPRKWHLIGMLHCVQLRKVSGQMLRGFHEIHCHSPPFLVLAVLVMAASACSRSTPTKARPGSSTTPIATAARSVTTGIGTPSAPTAKTPVTTRTSAPSTAVAGTPVLVKNYQLGFVDACNTLSFKLDYLHWVTANKGYTLLFVYLMIHDKDHPSSATPDLPKTSFSIADVDGGEYAALNSSVEGHCDSEDPARQCARYGEPFNVLVYFAVPENLINQPWKFLFKGTTAFTFWVGQGICPYKD